MYSKPLSPLIFFGTKITGLIISLHLPPFNNQKVLAMKKKILPLAGRCLISGILSIASCTLLHAQKFNPLSPSTWAEFVSGSNNPSIKEDTLRLQTFRNAPTDNLTYRTSGNTSIFNPLDDGITDASGGYALKLSPGSTLRVDVLPIKSSSYTLHYRYAVQKVKPGENLYISIDRKEPVENYPWIEVTEKDYSASFFTPKLEKADILQIYNEPYSAELRIGEAKDGVNAGYYAIDSVYVTGETNVYSLFTGDGNWQDCALWSHDPVWRYRHALVNGNASVNQSTACDRLFIGQGGVSVEPGKSLQAGEIVFCGPESYLRSSGEVHVSGKATVHRTFAEKGRWYFISFPFDVYADGIDAGFQLKDDALNQGGNYFYLYRYNGEKRSANNSASMNWEVLPSGIMQENRPVFEKNKGYLIALDEKADRNSLSFSSRTGDIPEGFGRNGTIAVSVPLKGDSSIDSHYGWYLCGNPLPSPLPLSSIQSNENLDGYAYIYDEGGFKAYPLTSEYALPPFAAFFVKAGTDTELTINPSSPATRQYAVLPASAPLQTLRTEPQTSPVSSGLAPQIQRSSISGHSLHLENILTPGTVYVTDFTGRTVWRKKTGAGSSVIPLPLTAGGVYILHIETSSYQSRHKFIR
jgi:hypothetical protein